MNRFILALGLLLLSHGAFGATTTIAPISPPVCDSATCSGSSGSSSGGGSGSGTVTTFSCVTANGVSCSVANPTTTPAATITLGAINPSSIGATTSAAATVTTLTAATVNATNANLSGTTTVNNPTITGTCKGCFTPNATLLGLVTTETGGNLFPYTYFGSSTTGAAANGTPSWGVVASLGADTVLRFRFKMPPTLPGTGTLNLCSLCQSSATSGVVKYTISDSMIPVNNTASPSGTAQTAETQNSITWSAADNYVETCTPLTPTPVANQVSAGGITFNTSGWTLAQILACTFTESWR